MTDFDCLADSLTIEFKCTHCCAEITHEIESLPSPDWGADTSSGSENSDDDYCACENCGHEYCIDIYVNICEGNIVVTDAESNEEVEDVKVEESYLEENDYLEDEDDE